VDGDIAYVAGMLNHPIGVERATVVPHVLCAEARALRITAVFECGDPTMMMINKDQQRVSTQL
jgi:hypothetical protein